MLTRFFGREDEIAALAALLQGADDGGGGGARLVTLTGPGGSGKTRLAVETARRLGAHFRGGVWFVTLAELAEPERVPA
jgi:predicted ATPase